MWSVPSLLKEFSTDFLITSGFEFGIRDLLTVLLSVSKPIPNFVAMTTLCFFNIFPISSSLWWGLSAVPYTSAVSKNVQPKSMAFSISSVASFSVEGVP